MQWTRKLCQLFVEFIYVRDLCYFATLPANRRKHWTLIGKKIYFYWSGNCLSKHFIKSQYTKRQQWQCLSLRLWFEFENPVRKQCCCQTPNGNESECREKINSAAHIKHISLSDLFVTNNKWNINYCNCWQLWIESVRWRSLLSINVLTLEFKHSTFANNTVHTIKSSRGYICFRNVTSRHK